MTSVRILVVSGKSQTVTVYRKGDAWVVRGISRGSPVRVEARSEKAALDRWLRTAEGKAASAGEAKAGKVPSRKAPARKAKAGKVAAVKASSKGKVGKRKS